MGAEAKQIKIPRLARTPVGIPSGVEIKLQSSRIDVKGPKGSLGLDLHPTIKVEQGDDGLRVDPTGPEGRAMSGTFRSLINNLVIGVTDGFEKKLTLVGVGYRAQAKGKTLELALGFSHPVLFPVPEGIKIETPSQTEIVISGADKQLVGEVSAKIRAYRPPEPYKGKGVR